MEVSPFQSELFKDDNLLRRFEKIHDYIYANDGLSSQQTLEAIVKILFVKIYDEKNSHTKFNISSGEIKALEQSCSSLSLQRRFSSLLEKTKKEFGEVFDVDDKIKLSDLSLGFTVSNLQSVSLSGSSLDAKGLAFQKFLSHQEKDGRGQFFTPEPVVDFCVNIIQPNSSELISDPACGSGGFLISSLKYIAANCKNVNLKNIISENLFGFDVNKSIARIAKMKMLLESNTRVNIACVNSLSSFDEKIASLCFSNGNSFDGFDVILTNPPFGGKITNKDVLVQYGLGHKWLGSDSDYYKIKEIRNSQSTEALFIEKCLRLLKKGGRMAIVLPNGYFENPSLQYLRSYIKKKANILAIIKLPQGTFITYGTGVKTSLLFLQKKIMNQIKNYPFFLAR